MNEEGAVIAGSFPTSDAGKRLRADARELPCNQRAPVGPGQPALSGAVESIQSGLADTQSMFVRTISECHLAYLKAMGVFAHGVHTDGEPTLQSDARRDHHEDGGVVRNVVALGTPSREVPLMPVSDGGQPRPVCYGSAQNTDPVGQLALQPEYLSEPTLSGPESSPGPALGELESLLFSVVAENTGYPKEVLKLDMELQGDLGIDSIKRVEIISDLEERMPVRRKPDAIKLSGARTLGDIVGYLTEAAGGAGQ